MKGSGKNKPKFMEGISRREFLERTVAGSLIAGLGLAAIPPEALAAAPNNEPGAAGDANGGVSLKVVGDEKQGYSVAILHGGRIIARHNEGGEFSAVFQNGERSLEDRVTNWKAKSWTGDNAHVTLHGECKLAQTNATVFAQVEYDVIDSRVVRKKIRFQQADMFLLFYQLTNRMEPIEPPAKFWSFDQTDCRGGCLREYFPAAGFRAKDGLCVGLLTDSGFRNQWNRVVRRDGKPVKPAPRRISDSRLVEVASRGEGDKGQFYVQQTFGELIEQADGQEAAEPVALPGSSSWVRNGEAVVHEQDGIVSLRVRNSASGVLIPMDIKAGEIYSVRLEYRSPQAVGVEIWDVDEQRRKIQEITQYDDRIPESPSEWSEFRTTVFVPALTGVGGALYLSLPPSDQATELENSAPEVKMEFRGLQVSRLETRSEPYHRLEMGQSIEKTVFIFADDAVPDTLRGYRLASQIHLADALGFRGGETEKILYADLMMLCWNAGTEEFRPMLAPSIWYSAAGEMYLRDSFFALNGIRSRVLNLGVFDVWADNQGTDGAINTLVEPNMSNLERKSNDSTPLWLIWALRNRKRFNAALPMEKVKKAAEYCLRTYDPNHDGLCRAEFVMGQLDIVSYPQGTSTICENQGLLAVILRVIRELQIPNVSATISEDRIRKAEENYRSYYDPANKFVRSTRDVSGAIGFAEIFPDFLSLWLFNRKLLTDEMVVNHLDRIPVMLPRPDSPFPETGGTVRPIFIGLSKEGDGWRYFTENWHPMASDAYAVTYAKHGMDGIYYNGGSWMRIEICGYVAGMLHGWTKAKKAIANRLWAEINVSPDFPTSQEYLATDAAHPFFGYHRVFAWNSFVLQVLEFAGLREAAMDPDFEKP